MVINDRYRFVFIHIPKNAGIFIKSSIEQLSETTIYSGSKKHFDNEILDESHMPLSITKIKYPEEYKKILDYDSFAIIRNPITRFPASFQEHLRTHNKLNINNLKKSELVGYLNDVVKILDENREKELLPIKLVHFQKQIFYVNLSNQRIIKNLYLFDDVQKLFIDFVRITGAPLEINVILNKHPVNKSVNLFRNKFLRYLAESNRPLKGRLLVHFPMVFQKTFNYLVHVPFAEKNKEIFKSNHIQEFIKDYYQEDIQLYNELINTI